MPFPERVGSESESFGLRTKKCGNVESRQIVTVLADITGRRIGVTKMPRLAFYWTINVPLVASLPKRMWTRDKRASPFHLGNRWSDIAVVTC